MKSCKPTNSPVYIYGLYTDKNAVIRYIGKTIHPIEKRLNQHIESHKRTHTHKNVWIKKCLKNNEKILIKLIEVCSDLTWNEREIYWISELKIKNKLTNDCKGGIGGHFIKYTWSYNKLKNYLKNNFKNIKTAREYKEYFREHKIENVPLKPEVVYEKRGWKNWGDFLNSENIHSSKKIYSYYTYEKAKKILHKKEIKTMKQYLFFIKENNIKKLPTRPDVIYKKYGWLDWSDFLNTKTISKQQVHNNYLNYTLAKEWIKINKPLINSMRKYREFTKDNKFPIFLPKKPERSYKKEGWIDWYDYLNKKK